MKSVLSRTRSWMVLILVVAALFTWGIARFPTPQVHAPGTAALKWDDLYATLPMSFEANLGQSGSAAKFISRGRGYTLFLTSNEAVLSLTPRVRRPDGKATELRKPSETQTRESTVLRMQMRGAESAPQVSGEDVLPGKNHYFIGNDPTKWRTNVPTYEKVRYRGVYPGIDLVYYGNGRQLEYDFIVGPGADPAVIQLAFNGSSHIALDSSGDLVLQAGTAAEEIRLHKPVVYQNVNGKKQNVAAEYLLDGRNVGFKVSSYDVRHPLVIDPVLSYSTYLGGSSQEQAYGIAVDGSGNAYVTGYTESSNFPTVNPLQGIKGAQSDVFVAKLNSAGSALLFSTYFGGAGVDVANSIAVDNSGNAYVTGSTNSSNFPTVNPLQPAYGGDSAGGVGDAFVVKLNSAGSVIFYSSYLGGTGSDSGTGIAADNSGNAYVTGFTDSNNFPLMNPLQPVFNLSREAFVAKLNSAGSALVYSTYLGGSSTDNASEIATDSSGNAYVTGTTLSSNFPTVNALQPTYGGGSSDAFVSKLNPAGSALLYSTYLGGSSGDAASGIAADSLGNAYVTGGTGSSNFPTVNAIQPALRGIFVTKLNPAGSAFIYSTYFGGSIGTQNSRGIAADNSGNAYVTGTTNSTDFPIAAFLQPAWTGTADAFVFELNPAGSALVFSSYLGGSGIDGGNAIAVDGLGNVYVAGVAGPGFPTVNPVQGGVSGPNHVFVSKISPVSAPLPTATSVSPSSVAQGFCCAVTVTGTNFVPGSTWVTIDGSNYSSGVLENGIVNVTPTSATVSFTVSPSAALGPRNIAVVVPSGTSNTLTFTVTGASPTLSSINLTSGSQGATMSVTLTGTFFSAGSTTVNVSGTGVTASSTNVLNSNQLTTTLTIASSASPGARSVTVTTPDGTSNALTFTVVAATSPLTLTSINPSSGVQGGSVSVTLTGTNFVAGSTSVAVSGSGVATGSAAVPNSTSLTTTFTIAAGAATGPRNVTVTTPDGTSNAVTFSVGADTTPPVISAVSAGNPSTSAVVISWTTDEASDSQVEYGTTTAYGQTTPLNGSLLTSHSAILTGLTANTTYHYRVRSRDAAGNLATSVNLTFTTAAGTDTTPPVISAVFAGSISTSTVTISWTTNELSDSQAEYGTTTSYGQATPLNAALVTSHSLTLTGLVANTTYHYRVLSADASGNRSTGTDFLFTTTAGSSYAVPFVVPNTGGISRTSDGAGLLSSGYVRIQAGPGSTTPSGLAVFGYRQAGILVSEAGVPDSPLISSGRIYAEVSADALVNTGLAIANPNATTAIIFYTIRDTNGNTLKDASTTIGPNQQLSRFLDQAPYLSGTGIQGTFSFTSTVPVSVIALRGFYNERTPSEFLITTLPVLDLSAGTSLGTQVIPHFAAGDGWTTQVILVNSSGTPQTGTIQFIDKGAGSTPGAPKTVTIDGVTGSSASYSVAANSSKKFLITGASPGTATGSVWVAPLAGGPAPLPLVIFSYKPSSITVSEAGVPVRMGTTFRMFAQLSSSPQILTGVAIANATATAGTVTLTLSDLNGVTIATTNPPLTLSASGQIAGFIDQLIPSLAGQTVQGVLRISTDIPNISVVGLRGRYNERLPVSDFLITTTTPTLENGIPNTAERLFPHFANGEGYTTEFILFSGTSGQTSSGSLQFFTQAGGTPTFTVH